MYSWFKRFLSRETGQDLVEYTLLIALVALTSTGLFMGAGTSASSVWSSANSVLALGGSPSSTPPDTGGNGGGGGDHGGDHGHDGGWH